ncbi:MAG: branched-chain amino acid ABC transporter permease [Clostridiales Family XIII bacterium]|jgi:branched-chain amino acid transport system permease protein|nr:branched-chain amino acid ABC transporter permease [Clostridiales Family XIII bacterium]
MTLFLTVLINGCILGSVYALVALGLNTQYGVAHILNIAHGEFIILSAFITMTLYAGAGLHPLVALAVAGPIVFAISFVLHRTLYKRVKDMSANIGEFEGNAILVAFGIYFIVQNLMRDKWGSATSGYQFMAFPVRIGPADIAANNLFVLLWAVVICVVYYLFLMRTRTGKAIRAAAQDAGAAALLGVKINTIMALCFAIGGLLAAFAGVLISMKEPFTTVSGMNYTTIAFIVVVLGGLGNVKGAILGGFILGIVGYAVSTYDTGMMFAVFYLIVLVLLIVRPKGLLGR